MNSAEQMSVLAELERKGLLTSDVASRADAGVYGKMYDLITTYNPNTGSFGLENTQAAREAYLKKYASVNTDWFDLLFKNSLVQEHALSISGGTEKSQTYFSASFYGDNGWTIADKVRRYTMNFRNNYNFSDKLSVGFLTAGSVRQQTAPGALSRTSNPVEGTYDRDFDINPFSYSLNTSRTMTAYNDSGRLDYFRRNYAPFNIIEELQNNTLTINVLDVKLQGELAYKFNKNLRYEFIGAIRYVKSTREHEIKESSNMANAYRAAGNSTIRENNKFLYRDPDNPGSEPIVVLPFGGFYNRQEDQLMNYDIRNSLNYTNTFGENHALNVLVGQQIKYADRQNFNNTGYGYQYNNGGTPFIDYRILKQTIENNFNYYGMGKDYDRFAAFYSTANYTYKGKYNLTGTARYDGSNRLGESKRARWLPTWSIGGSWNIEGEEFMKDISFINYATLRATYGLTGSMGPATNSSIVLENEVSNRPYLAEKESVIRLIALENSELTWEKQYTTNLGLDVGFYQRRLTLSMDVYQRKSFDLISIVKTSGIGGELEKVANYADLHSKGIEVMLTGEIIRKNDFGWRSNINFGYNYNEIANAQNRPNIFDLVKAEGGNINGYPVNSLFSLSFQGLDHHTGIPTFIDERGNHSQDVYLQDDSTQYLVYSGPVDPPFTGGFSNTFRYKSLSLNVFITYQAGNKIRLYPAFNTNYSDLDAMPREFVDRWVFPGDETKTIIPSIVDAFAQNALGSAYPFNNYNYSTARVADGGFVRLKTVSLTYELPRTLIQKAKLNTFSITAAATNPWLIYSDPKLKGQDPEFFNTGGVAQPVQKMFTLSLKVGI
jgi:TonB-linked SusC/RagA family outer membrane protein